MANTVKYMKTNWRLLNKDGKSWIGHIFILGLLTLIPIVGAIFVAGYSYRWAKRTAWGMHTSPNQDGLKLGDAFSKGWLVFLYLFVMGALWGIIFASLQVVVGSIPLIGVLVSLFLPLFSTFVNVILDIAALRVVIYDEFKAGFMFPQIFDLCSRDWNGILKITGISILLNILTGIIGLIFVIPLLIGIGPMLLAGPQLGDPDYYSAIHFSVSSILTTPSLIVPMIIGIILLMFLSVFTSVFITNLCGIWMAQFYPECWGPSSEYAPINPGPVMSASKAASPAEDVLQVSKAGLPRGAEEQRDEAVLSAESLVQDMPEEEPKVELGSEPTHAPADKDADDEGPSKL